MQDALYSLTHPASLCEREDKANDSDQGMATLYKYRKTGYIYAHNIYRRILNPSD